MKLFYPFRISKYKMSFFKRFGSQLTFVKNNVSQGLSRLPGFARKGVQFANRVSGLANRAIEGAERVRSAANKNDVFSEGQRATINRVFDRTNALNDKAQTFNNKFTNLAGDLGIQ